MLVAYSRGLFYIIEVGIIELSPDDGRILDPIGHFHEFMWLFHLFNWVINIIFLFMNYRICDQIERA